jgi:uncharacterized protein YndB with AHSA1/START domain
MFKWLFGKKGDAEAPEVGGNAELIVISRRVKAPADKAFARFVDEIGTWWPKDLTWAKDNLAGMKIEPKLNGRATELSKNGGEEVWGTVLTVRRPDHLVLAWQIKADRTPEAEERTSSRVDVRFVPVDPETTEIVVVHRDFPRHGDGWQSYKAGMAGKDGWPRLIEAYARSFG